jgi:cytochrome c biogenesis protein CcmG/thiol:disulfide interchange protein DsbE
MCRTCGILALAACLATVGCFEGESTLSLNGDGSGHYEGVIRLNAEMSALVAIAEKVVEQRGSLPSAAESPLGVVAGNLESEIRGQVAEIPGGRLAHLETTYPEGPDGPRELSLRVEFDDVYAFLESAFGRENVGLRLSKDEEGNLRIVGGATAVLSSPDPSAPDIGSVASQMRAQFGIPAGEDFDALFLRVWGNPRIGFTLIAPAEVLDTNGTQRGDFQLVSWEHGLTELMAAGGGDLYEAVIDRSALDFEVRDMAARPMAAPSPVAGEGAQFIGNPAPDFTLADLDGNDVSLSDFEGKVIILDFWATWCGPCVVEIPYFIKMQEEFAEQGFTMLGISVDEDRDVVPQFVEEHGINYPVLMADGVVQGLYGGVNAIPTTLVIDREGIVRRYYVGTQPEPVFRSDVMALLAGEELAPQPADGQFVPPPPALGVAEPLAPGASPALEARLTAMGYDAKTVANPMEVTLFEAVGRPVVTALEKHAGTDIAFGWYQGEAHNLLFDMETLGRADPMGLLGVAGVAAELQPDAGPFGFYIAARWDKAYLWRTESHRNSDGPHVKVYPAMDTGNVVPNAYLLCWEDIPLGTIADEYYDLLVRVDGVRPVNSMPFPD